MSAVVQALRELLSHVPLSDEQQATAADLVRRCSSEELAALGLAAPAKPSLPRLMDKMPLRQRLAAVQGVINSIEYNHNPGYFYNVSKDRPFCRIMDTARDVLREALPIKCIEAVFLGALLTAGWDGLQRLPLSFKSGVNGQTYRHIVLVLHHVPTQKWGTLGISRRDELMFKELAFDSLSDLVLEFKRCYERWWHKLRKAEIGLPLDHDVYSNGAVCWRNCAVSPAKQPWDACALKLDKFAEEYKQLLAKFKVLGFTPARGEGQRAAQPATEKAVAAPGTVNAATASSSTPRLAKSESPTKRTSQPLKPAAGSLAPLACKTILSNEPKLQASCKGQQQQQPLAVAMGGPLHPPNPVAGSGRAALQLQGGRTDSSATSGGRDQAPQIPLAEGSGPEARRAGSASVASSGDVLAASLAAAAVAAGSGGPGGYGSCGAELEEPPFGTSTEGCLFSALDTLAAQHSGNAGSSLQVKPTTPLPLDNGAPPAIAQ